MKKKRVFHAVMASGMSMILAVSPVVTPVNGMCKGNVGKNVVTYVKVQGESTDENEDFEIENGVLVSYSGEDTNVIIPSTVNTIGESAFVGSEITSVVIPSSVTKIENGAFHACTNLTSISIPNSVNSIGTQVFSNCSSLTSVNLPSGMNSIPYEIFNGCSSLSSITIPSGVTSIGQDAFNGCSSLGHIDIPSGVTTIGPDAFNGCSSLSAVTIPNNITIIESGVFGGCSALSSISIPSQVTEIQGNAFKNCTSLTSATILKNVTYIESDAFANCGSLTISGYADTEAESYAKENSISFRYINGSGATTAPTATAVPSVTPSATPSVEFTTGDFEAAPSIEFGVGNAKFENIFPGKLKIGFNFIPFSSCIKTDKEGNRCIRIIFPSSEYKSIEDFEKQYQDAEKSIAAIKSANDARKAFKGKMASLTPNKSLTPTLLASGYYEMILDSKGNIISQGGNLSVSAKLEGKYTQQFLLGPVPMYYEIGGSFEGKGDVQLNRNQSNGNWNNSLTLTFTPEFSLGGGVGVSGVASVGLKGTASFPVKVPVNSTDSYNVSVKGSAEVVINVLFLVDWSWEFAGFEKQLLPQTNSSSVSTNSWLKNSIVKSPYRLIERDYEKKTTDWNGGETEGKLHKSSTAGNQDIEETLQGYIMPNTVPKIETIGDSKVMVFQSTDSSRETANSVKLMYSVYTNGTWSKPEVVWDNGTADYFADIKTINDELYLVWQKSKSKISSTDTDAILAEMLGKCEICYAKYNKETQKFENPKYITDNSTLDMMPKLAENGESPAVVWINNDKNNFSGTSGTNKILGKTLEDGQWTEAQMLGETTQYISELTPYCEDGTLYATFNASDNHATVKTQSVKNSVTAYAESTDTKTKTYVTQKDSEDPKSLSDGSSIAVDVQYLNGDIYWVEDGIMKQYNTSTENTTEIAAGEEGCISNSATVYENGDKTAILWSETTEDGYQICSSVKTEDGYSEPVVVQESNDSTVQHYDAALEEDGTWNIIVNEKSNSSSEESSFVYAEKAEKVDTELNYVEVEEEKSNDNITVNVTNTSEKAVNGLNFKLSDQNKVYDEQELTATLLPGETKIFTITADLSKITETKEVNISVSSEKETDLSNNVQKLTVGKTELTLVTGKTETDNAVTIVSTITNTSKIDTTAEIKLMSETEGGVALASRKISLSAGESKICEFGLDKSKIDFTNGTSKGYFVTVNADTTEGNETDNSQVVVVYKTETTPTVTTTPQVTTAPTVVNVGKVSAVKVVKKASKKAKVSWKKVSGAKGYQIVYAENSAFTKKCKKVTINKLYTVLSGLKKGKTYYIKVRAYKNTSTGKKYGKYSVVKKYKVK